MMYHYALGTTTKVSENATNVVENPVCPRVTDVLKAKIFKVPKAIYI